VSIAADVAPADGASVPDARTLIRRARWSDAGLFAVLLATALLLALALASALLAVADASPFTVFDAIIDGSLGSIPALATTLNHTSLILVVAAGTCIAFRAGMVNIGQEGQLSIGGLTATAVALGLPFAGPGAIVVILVAGALGGAVWAVVPALLRFGRGVSEVVTTLLLNFVAFQAVSYAVNQPRLLQEDVRADSVTAPSPQSNRLPDDDMLPALASGTGYRLHIGIVIAVVLALAVGFLIRRTTLGFRLRVFGFNPRAARRLDVKPGAMGGGALIASAAFAGLAGALLLTGVTMRLQGGFSSGVYGSFSNNFGWEGLVVALVATYDPVYAIPVGFLFGALRAGSGALTATGISPTIAAVVQALVLIAVTVPALLMVQRRRRRTVQAVRRERI
jgi:simple sugar transport system permease protein